MDSESRPNQVNSETKGKDELLKGDWGNTVIDQARVWDLPPSPQSSGLVWSATGTEIWKNNNNNNNNNNSDKTKGSTNQWGHTPSTHIGGTWGEEEDSANLWTGVPSSNNVRAFYGECIFSLLFLQRSFLIVYCKAFSSSQPKYRCCCCISCSGCWICFHIRHFVYIRNIPSHTLALQLFFFALIFPNLVVLFCTFPSSNSNAYLWWLFSSCIK